MRHTCIGQQTSSANCFSACGALPLASQSSPNMRNSRDLYPGPDSGFLTNIQFACVRQSSACTYFFVPMGYQQHAGGGKRGNTNHAVCEDDVMFYQVERIIAKDCLCRLQGLPSMRMIVARYTIRLVHSLRPELRGRTRHQAANSALPSRRQRSTLSATYERHKCTITACALVVLCSGDGEDLARGLIGPRARLPLLCDCCEGN